MGDRTVTQTPFVEWLESAMAQRDLKVRTLARRMNTENTEAARRAINRWRYDGTMPTPAYRKQLAQALGIPEDDIPESDDQEPGL